MAGDSRPLTNQKVYLFSPSGTYLGQSRTTDASGQAVFTLPGMAYVLRLDHLGQQYFAESFVWTDPENTA